MCGSTACDSRNRDEWKMRFVIICQRHTAWLRPRTSFRPLETSLATRSVTRQCHRACVEEGSHSIQCSALLKFLIIFLTRGPMFSFCAGKRSPAFPFQWQKPSSQKPSLSEGRMTWGGGHSWDCDGEGYGFSQHLRVVEDGGPGDRGGASAE